MPIVYDDAISGGTAFAPSTPDYSSNIVYDDATDEPEPEPTPYLATDEGQTAFLRHLAGREKPFEQRVYENLGPVARGVGRAAETGAEFVVTSALRGASYLPGLGKASEWADHINRTSAVRRVYDDHLDRTGTFADVFGETAATVSGTAAEALTDLALLRGAGKAAGVKTPQGFQAWFPVVYGARDAERSLTTGRDAGLRGPRLYGYALLNGGVTAAFTRAFGLAGEKIGVGTAEELISRGAGRALQNLFTRTGLSKAAVSAGLEGTEEEIIGATQGLWNHLTNVSSFDEYVRTAGDRFITAAAATGGIHALQSGAAKTFGRAMDNTIKDLPDTVAGTVEAQNAVAEAREPNIPEGASDAYKAAVADEQDFQTQVRDKVVGRLDLSSVKLHEALLRRAGILDTPQGQASLEKVRQWEERDKRILREAPPKQTFLKYKKVEGDPEAAKLDDEAAALAHETAKETASRTAAAEQSGAIDRETEKAIDEFEKQRRRSELTEFMAEKNAHNNKVREFLGLDKLPPWEGGKPWDEVLLDVEDSRMQEYAVPLATEALQNPGTTWNQHEEVATAVAAGDRIMELEEVRKAQKLAATDEEAGSLIAREQELVSEIDLLTTARARVGSEAGAAFNIRKFNPYEDPQSALVAASHNKRRGAGGRKKQVELEQSEKEMDRKIDTTEEKLENYEITSLRNELTRLVDDIKEIEAARIGEQEGLPEAAPSEDVSTEAKIVEAVQKVKDFVEETRVRREEEVEAGGASSPNPNLVSQIDAQLRKAVSTLRAIEKQRRAGGKVVQKNVDKIVQGVKNDLKRLTDALKPPKSDKPKAPKIRTFGRRPYKRTVIDDPISAAMEQQLVDAHRQLTAIRTARESANLTPEERDRILNAAHRVRDLYNARTTLQPGTDNYDQVDLDLSKAKSALNDAMQAPSWSKLRRNLAEASGFYNALRLGMDASLLAIQGGLPMVVKPSIPLRALPVAVKAFKSEMDAFKAFREVDQRPNADRYRKGDITVPTSDMPMTTREDHLGSAFARTLPVFRNFDRAARVFLAKVRADLYDWKVELEGGRSNLTDHNLSQLGLFVDQMTGRGGRGYADRWADIARLGFLAPRYCMSQVELLTGYPIWSSKDQKTRKMVGKEYGRALANMGFVYASVAVANTIAEASGEEKPFEMDFDPTSPYFMNIKAPGAGWFDPTFRLARWVGQGARTMHLAYTSLTDPAAPVPTLAHGHRKSRLLTRTNSEPMERELERRRWINFFRGKESLPLGAVTDLMMDQHIDGEKVSPLSMVARHSLPIPASELIDQAEEYGLPRALGVGLLNFFGANIRPEHAPRPNKAPSSRL